MKLQPHFVVFFGLVLACTVGSGENTRAAKRCYKITLIQGDGTVEVYERCEGEAPKLLERTSPREPRACTPSEMLLIYKGSSDLTYFNGNCSLLRFYERVSNSSSCYVPDSLKNVVDVVSGAVVNGQCISNGQVVTR